MKFHEWAYWALLAAIAVVSATSFIINRRRIRREARELDERSAASSYDDWIAANPPPLLSTGFWPAPAAMQPVCPVCDHPHSVYGTCFKCDCEVGRSPGPLDPIHSDAEYAEMESAKGRAQQEVERLRTLLKDALDWLGSGGRKGRPIDMPGGGALDEKVRAALKEPADV